MNLLNELENKVIKTSLSRKITINGETKAYPVYKIHIDLLYYNDQNDRIATWISEYKNTYGEEHLSSLNKDEYNKVIENFIYNSNPQSIEKTQMNISVVGQRESGVVLADGRIIDGNRRYTCIRRLYEQDPTFCWFETIILNFDLNASKKVIKMLELSIQHGEEKRVDYNHVEKLIGVYQDIIESQLLTIDEYAMSTNESIGEIRRKVEASKMVVEFLEFINLPKQFHIVRDFQIVSLINDVQETIKKCNSLEMVNNLKKITYANFLMNVTGDGRKYIKNINGMIGIQVFDNYVEDMQPLLEQLLERIQKQNPRTYTQIKTFANLNSDISEEMKDLLDKYVNGYKKQEVRNKPSQVVAKTINSLKDIDLNIINKLTPIEKEQVNSQVERLTKMVNQIQGVINEEPETIISGPRVVAIPKTEEKKYYLSPSKVNEKLDIQFESDVINSLFYDVKVKTIYEDYSDIYKFFFVDSENELCSNVIEIKVTKEIQTISFELTGKASSENNIKLCIKKKEDQEGYLREMFIFEVKMSFSADFGI